MSVQGENKPQSRLDISGLSPEKQAFLEANPKLLKNIEEAIPKQVEKLRTQKKRRRKGKAKWQRELEETMDKARSRAENIRGKAEKLRREYMMDPHLRSINEKLRAKADVGSKGLVCPECGESDRGNKMNRRPWCMKCNMPLIRKDKVAKWLKRPSVKAVRKDLREEFKRRGLDF